MIELPVRRLREDASLPVQAYAGDAGLDLAACDRHEVGPGERAVIPTGLALEIPDDVARPEVAVDPGRWLGWAGHVGETGAEPGHQLDGGRW